jgi:hypothetical protein
MKTYLLTPPQTSTPLSQALRSNKPLNKPLSRTEKQVVFVLMKGCQCEVEEPDAVTREFILAISRTDSNQWARIVEASPEKAEIIEAINNFFYGNLIDRCFANKAKETYHE